jgi:hypothetical protein
MARVTDLSVENARQLNENPPAKIADGSEFHEMTVVLQFRAAHPGHTTWLRAPVAEMPIMALSPDPSV